MKKTIFLLLLFLFSFAKFSIAQQAKIDSLLNLLKKAKPDTNKVNHFYRVADIYCDDYNFTKAKLYLDSAKALAEKLNFKQKLADIYQLLGYMSEKRGNYSEAMKYNDSCLVILKMLDSKNQMAMLYQNISVLQSNFQNFEQALKYSDTSLHFYRETNDKRGVFNVLELIGAIYDEQGNYPAALKYHYQAVKGFEELKDTGLLIMGNINIANVYYNTGEYADALKWYIDVLKIVPHRDKDHRATLYNNIGTTYVAMNNLEEGLRNQELSLKIREEIGNPLDMAESYNNIGMIHLNLHHVKEAEQYFFEALKIADKTGQKAIEINACLNLSDVLMAEKKFEEARQYMERALRAAKQAGSLESIANCYDYLSRVESASGNWQKSLEYYKMYVQVEDSMLNEDNSKVLTEMQTKFETEKKDNSIALLNKDNEIKTSEIQKQKTIRNGVIGAVGLVAVFSLLLITSRNRRKKAAVEKQMAEVEMKALRAQMNPHFIFNALNSIMRFVRKNDATSAEDYLGKFSKLVRIILENSRQQEVTLASDLNALQLYMDLEAMRLENKFQYKIEVDENINKETTYVPPLLLQPFVENSIWHGISQKEGKGNIRIRIRKKNEMLQCEVEDDGIGRKATESASGGLGMTITGERLNLINQQRKLKATMKVVDLEKGTIVLVSLPYVDDVIASGAKQSL